MSTKSRTQNKLGGGSLTNQDQNSMQSRPFRNIYSDSENTQKITV